LFCVFFLNVRVCFLCFAFSFVDLFVFQAKLDDVEQLEETYKQLRRDKKPAIEIAEAYTAWQKAAYDRAKKRLNGEAEVVVAEAKAVDSPRVISFHA